MKIFQILPNILWCKRKTEAYVPNVSRMLKITVSLLCEENMCEVYGIIIHFRRTEKKTRCQQTEHDPCS